MLISFAFSVSDLAVGKAVAPRSLGRWLSDVWSRFAEGYRGGHARVNKVVVSSQRAIGQLAGLCPVVVGLTAETMLEPCTSRKRTTG